MQFSFLPAYLHSGEKVSLLEIQEVYHDDYYNLSEQELEAMLKEHMDMKENQQSFRRPTPRGRTANANNLIRIIQNLVRNPSRMSHLQLADLNLSLSVSHCETPMWGRRLLLSGEGH